MLGMRAFRVLIALMLRAHWAVSRGGGFGVSVFFFLLVCADTGFGLGVRRFVGAFAQRILLDVLEAQVDTPAGTNVRALRFPVGVDGAAGRTARGIGGMDNETGKRQR